jgi:hypothetical protein
MMRLILIAAALTILAPGVLSAQSAKQKASIEQEIKRLDLDHAAAIPRGDLAALDRLWTEDFIVNNPFNEIDKANRIRSGAVTYASFVREPEAIIFMEHCHRYVPGDGGAQWRFSRCGKNY